MSENFSDSEIYNQGKLEQRINSLKSIKSNIDQDIWKAQSDYYNSMGKAGETELNNLLQKKIQEDYNIRSSKFLSDMDILYKNYYDKLYILYVNQTYNNKQIEIINNTQYKIIEQRNVDSNLMNNLTTQNRIRNYKNNIYRNKKKEIYNISLLLTFLFIIILIILLLNYNKLKEANSKSNLFLIILDKSHKKFFPFYLIAILFIIIVFKQFNMAIMFLVVYSVISLFINSPNN